MYLDLEQMQKQWVVAPRGATFKDKNMFSRMLSISVMTAAHPTDRDHLL
jgi:3-deoxy-D-manno-octulosonic acid (KDO) 8-phosphate synthase